MANDALKEAARKELLRRAAAAELARRQQSQAQKPSGGAGWLDVAAGFTPLGMAQNLGKAAMDPMGSLQTMDDSVRMLANGATLGFADRIAGYMGGQGKEAERAKSMAAKERLGVTGDILEAGGAMLPATKAAQIGLTATRLPFIGKTLGLGIDGAALGGLQAFGNDQDVATGATIGAGAGLLGTGVSKMAEKFLTGKAVKAMQKAAPTEEAVNAEKNALYAALDNADVRFDANAYEQMLRDTSTALKTFRATKAPMTADTVQYMTQYKGTSPSFRDVEDILQEAKMILRENSATQTDKAAARIVVDKLSDFFDSAALSTNNSIPADQVAGMARKARELARRSILAREIRNMEDKADGYLGGDESGMRNQFGSFLQSNRRKGLTDAEKKAFKKVVRREGLLNLANLAGSRMGQIAQLSAGAAGAPFTGGASLAVAGAGLLGNYAARKGMERYTKKATERALQTVLAGRAAQSAAKPNQMQIENLNKVIRAGLLGLGSGAVANMN